MENEFSTKEQSDSHEAEFSSDKNNEENEEILQLKKMLTEDFTMFLLNNILMSVQFFENYDRDIRKLRDTCLEEYSLESGQFKCFEADSLHKLVDENVTFRLKSNLKKQATQTLHPLRTYVIYQNVELMYTPSTASNMNKYSPPYYKLTVQRCQDDNKELSGYVNLIESDLKEEKYESTTSSLIFRPDVLAADDVSTDQRKNCIHSGVIVSKNDNFYCLDPGKRTKPYSLKNYRTNEKITSPASLPKSCFKEHDKENMANRNRRMGLLANKQNTMQKMLISAAFKRHFCEVFLARLSNQMKFGIVNSESGLFRFDRIITKVKETTYHVIPSLELRDWPNEVNDFSEEVKKKNWIEWPTRNMQNILKKSGCALIPVGYYEASMDKSDYTLEWKFEFPKAEKYLLMHMMHTHIRCFLFGIILYKSYIENELTAVHFGPSHLVNLLYHMVRKNFAGWPEYRQGETLCKFLHVLHNTLQKKSLKSFFLHKRNLYMNCPLQVLHRTQTLIMQIIQNPIPYVLKALMNLKFREDFYSHLDYLRLYNILTVDDLAEYLNPSPPKKLKGRMKTEQQVMTKKIGKESIDEEELFQPKSKSEVKAEVLSLFINHFINVANHSLKYEGYDYTLLYLTHAKRLTVILEEFAVTRGEIQDLSNRISNIELRCKKMTGHRTHTKPHPAANLKTQREHGFPGSHLKLPKTTRFTMENGPPQKMESNGSANESESDTRL